MFTLWVCDWSHSPFWSLVVSKLVISARSWKFDSVQLDIASWTSQLH